MALSRTLLRTVSIDGRPPADALSRTNDLILADARSDLFVTMFYVILQPRSGDVAFVNAGHMPPLVVRAGEGTVDELRVPGMALGILPDVRLKEYSSHLKHGDTLILYGRQETIRDLDTRRAGIEGNMHHVMAVTRQIDVLDEEATSEEEIDEATASPEDAADD